MVLVVVEVVVVVVVIKVVPELMVKRVWESVLFEGKNVYLVD